MALSNREIAVVKGMLARGDRQHNIAAYFGINSGRIAEINIGDRAAKVSPPLIRQTFHPQVRILRADQPCTRGTR